MEITTKSFQDEVEKIAHRVQTEFNYSKDIDADEIMQETWENLHTIVDEHEWVVTYDLAYDMLKVCPNPDVIFEQGLVDGNDGFFKFITSAAYFALRVAVENELENRLDQFLEELGA